MNKITKYNICIIGSGYMARKHCSVLKDEPSVNLNTLVVSKQSKNADAFRAEFGFNNVYTTLEEALENEPVDIVYIISPNALHELQVCLSLDTGKHVFCEKPLCYTEDEFRSIDASLKKSGKLLQVGMNCRYREQFSIPFDLLRSGKIGNLNYARGTYIFNLKGAIDDKPWMMDFPKGIHPFLHSGAIHSLDLIRWFGGSIKNVNARANGKELNPDWGYDNFYVILELDNGAVAEFTGSSCANRPPDFSIELWGSKGSINEGNHNFYSENILIKRQIVIKQERIDLLMQFDDLVSSIENNVQPMNSFAEAYKNFELVTAIENSIKQNKTIKIN